jgi:hypothetical protein
MYPTLLLAATLGASANARPLAAQSAVVSAAVADSTAGNTTRLFASRDPIELTLSGDLRPILRDKSEEPPWRDATIAYVEGADSVRLPVRARTRGRFRLEHCPFPPLRLNFVKDSVKGTLFAHQDKPKLGTHCREGGDYEQYTVQEYLLYRVYEILSPYSFQARLARMTYVDTAGNMKPLTQWALLIEEPDALAERLGGSENEQPGVLQAHVDPHTIIVLGVFQFMIGNTDWSVPGLHNIVIVDRDGQLPLAVPYDFDWSGAIATRYAKPDPNLGTRSVTQRLWRTLCPTPDLLEPVVAHFNAKRPEIEALYRDFAPLEPKHSRRVLEYYGEFYETINDPRRMRIALRDVCQ